MLCQRNGAGNRSKVMDGRNARETQSQQRKCSEPRGPRQERTGLPLLGIKHQTTCQTRHENVLAHHTMSICHLQKRTGISMCARGVALFTIKKTSNYFSFLKRPVRRRLLIEPVLLAAADRTVWLATPSDIGVQCKCNGAWHTSGSP
jgi:hypothetical protein